MNNDAPEGTCYICGYGNPDSIQEHHIIPRRYDGSDASRNLVNLCPSCHDAVERIYDNAFFEEIGAEKGGKATHNRECEWRSCTADETVRLENDGLEIYVCEGHRECRVHDCGRVGSPAPVAEGSRTILCDSHRVCRDSECLSRNVQAYNTEYAGWRVLCEHHAKEDMFVETATEEI